MLRLMNFRLLSLFCALVTTKAPFIRLVTERQPSRFILIEASKGQ
jgi:hypothetical protein